MKTKILHLTGCHAQLPWFKWLVDESAKYGPFCLTAWRIFNSISLWWSGRLRGDGSNAHK